MFEADDLSWCIDQLTALCGIPSPTGFTSRVSDYLFGTLEALGFTPQRSRKGSVSCTIGGEGAPLVLAAHVDTLGAMVRSAKPNGRLRITTIGGYPELYVLTENCIVHTRDGREYSGTIQLVNPAVHVNRKIREAKPDDETVEVVLDLPVSDADSVARYGIRAGDIVSLDPRTVVTETGYIKSRHLDDKASAAILMTLASLVGNRRLTPARRTTILFTTYEEVGHGGSAAIPPDTQEMISVDMGAVGDDLGTTEHKVSICAKDSGGPYDYGVTTALISAAERAGTDFAVDIYPAYGSDVEATLRAGFDLRHGLIGPGVSASHGYERTHRDGIEHTLRLLCTYVETPGAE